MHRACKVLKQFPKTFISSKPISRSISIPSNQFRLLTCSHFHHNRSHGVATLGARSYSDEVRDTDGWKKGEHGIKLGQSSEHALEALPEITLEMLESIARAQALNMFPDSHESRLKLANVRLWQLFLYVFRPHDPDRDVVEHFGSRLLLDSVGLGTDIARARSAIAHIIRATVDCLSTIPMDSDVQRHSAIFDVVDNLVTLNDTYMDQGGQVENWSEFWGRAQLELLNLSRRLDDAGYGLPMHSDKDKKSNKGKNGFQMAREKRNGKVKQEVTPQMLLEGLESTATAPWVTMFPGHDEDRLLLAHSRLYQVFRYLAWPKTDPEDAERDYVDFTEASAGSDLDPDIARGRKAVAIIMRSVVDCLSTIPVDSEVRIKYRAVFDMLGPLMVLRNKYLTDEDGRVENWTKFWGVAHDAFFSLRLSLKKAGFNERPKNKGEPNIQTAS